MRGIKTAALCHPERKHYAHNMCRQCYGKTRKEHNAEYRADHIVEQKKRSAKWYKENTEHVTLKVTKRRLVKSGWTVERYDEKLEEQRGLCEICAKPEVIRALSADHEHIDPPRPRGLLCSSCNRALGYLKDDPVLLRKAADYIEKYKTQN
jgi:hypothetical protein